MEEIHRIRKISIWIFVVPIIVLNLCLFVSVNYQLFVGTIFHVDQVSITSFFSRLIYIKFKKINQETNKNKYFLFFGVGSALFLILHSIFLGFNFEMDLYKFFRRFILLGFIIFEIIAQALLVINLIKIKGEIAQFINKKILTIKMILVSVLIIVALLSAPILNSTEYTHFKHALEWNYFLGVVSFYLLTFLFWKRT